MNIDLSGKVALVTGASSGIGAETARNLAFCGAHVIVNYRSNSAGALEVVEGIVASGGSAEALCFDVSDDAAVKEAVAAVYGKHSRIDILVNNAGVSKDALLFRVKPDDYDRVMDSNLKGTFLCTFHVARYMIKQRAGRIVNISSVVGLGGNPGQSVYSASKAGVVGLTKSLAKELGPRGVLVNAVAPGLIETGMSSGVDREKIEGAIPLKRIGQPTDVAGVVLFLCSDLCGYVTGEVIVVDGGLYA